MSREEIAVSEFEVVAILEGIVESTGTTTQARTSYLPDEIFWGHEFENIIYENEGTHFVDFERFHQTQPIPGFKNLSAKDLHEEFRRQNPPKEGDDPVWAERKESTTSSAATSTPVKKSSSFRRSRQIEFESKLWLGPGTL